MLFKNLPNDKYAVIFRNNGSWTVTSNYDTPERALEAQEAFRTNYNTEAYAVNLRVLIENVPDFVLSQVGTAQAAAAKPGEVPHGAVGSEPLREGESLGEYYQRTDPV